MEHNPRYFVLLLSYIFYYIRVYVYTYKPRYSHCHYTCIFIHTRVRFMYIYIYITFERTWPENFPTFFLYEFLALSCAYVAACEVHRAHIALRLLQGCVFCIVFTSGK
jgi:hypothetical protein